MRVNLIAAVGNQGQLGLRNKLPWFDRKDLDFFHRMTTGKVVVMGSKTFESVFEKQPVWNDRMVIRMDRENSMLWDIGEHRGYLKPGVDRIITEFGPKDLDIFIAGGGQIYEAWMPYVQQFYITKIDYNGEADTWLKNLWDHTSSTA